MDANAKNQISINKRFAEQYEHSKRRQLLANTPAELLESSDESSSSEEDDEFAEQWTKKVDRRFRETLDAIRKKDPKIYDASEKFFDNTTIQQKGEGEGKEEDEQVDEEDEPVAGWDTIAKAADEHRPKMTMKDYVREQIITHGGLAQSDDDDDDIMESQSHRNTEEPSARAKSKSKSVNESDSDENDEPGGASDANDSDNDFFTKKDRTEAEMEAEEKQFERFLSKQSSKVSRKAGEDLLLHSYLENEKPDEKERFLRDFVLNNGWLDKNAAHAPSAGDYEIEIDTNNPDSDSEKEENDDEFDERNDNFEAQYNFRFEDPDGAQIVSHGRNISDTMRRPDDKRKRAREARKQKKERDKGEKTEEIKRLKNLKKKEIQARLLAIQEAAGDGIDVAGIDLDADFDPEAFDKQMNNKFGNDYYANTDEGMKSAVTVEMAHASEKQVPVETSEDVPDDMRQDVNQLMDEYYNLDYEDIVGGKPTRFTYKKVDGESFGLSAEDILEMDDKELNRLVSVKYLAPYCARRDVQKQAWKARTALRKIKQEKQNHREYNGDGSGANQWTGNGENGYHADSRKNKKRKRPRSSDGAEQEENGGNEQIGSQNLNGSMLPQGEKAEEPPVDHKTNEASRRKRKKKKVAIEAQETLANPSPAPAPLPDSKKVNVEADTTSKKARRKKRKSGEGAQEKAPKTENIICSQPEIASNAAPVVDLDASSSKKEKKKKKRSRNRDKAVSKLSQNRLKAYGIS